MFFKLGYPWSSLTQPEFRINLTVLSIEFKHFRRVFYVKSHKKEGNKNKNLHILIYLLFVCVCVLESRREKERKKEKHRCKRKH